MALKIHLLGPLIVKRGGRPLGIPRRQTRALLCRLATQPNPVPREQLCYHLWPDKPEATARRHMSRLLTHLRRALPAPDLLLIEDDRVALDHGRIWSDTVAFKRLCAASEPERQLQTLQRAVTLYRGSFLDGFSLPTSSRFEAWVALERSVWERRYLKALAALIGACTIRGKHDAAIAYARSYLATDALAEDVHRGLIKLYAMTGNRSAALRQFDQCVIVLERELGVKPLPETRATYKAALTSHTPLNIFSATGPAWTTLSGLDAPLFGRERELQLLEQAYVHAQAGQGSVFFISGEAGIGKTRLVNDFATKWTGEATVVIGGGHETERDLPYCPLVEALRSHLPAINWTSLNLAPFFLAEITHLLPELRALLPGPQDSFSVEPELEQGHLFEALACLFLKLAVRHPPLVLCLDDLHWADEVTLSWLGYLARRLKSAPILVLGAYRTEEAMAIATLRAELVREGILQELCLQGLSPGETLRLIRHLSGMDNGAEQLSRRLYRQTDGNPFFLLETLRILLENNRLRPDQTSWHMNFDKILEDSHQLPLPDVICNAVRTCLDRLNLPARQVLEAGAVIGREFDFDLIWVVSGRPQGEMVDALDSLLARQVIKEHDGRYWFNHDLVRAVVYRDLSYGRRRLLHQRVGEALEKR